MESGIYVGTLRHRRMAPRRHEFTYPIFMVYLDVDCLPELMRISPLSSYNRWNWVSYQERDHFGDPQLPLRRRMEDDANKSGIALPDGKLFLLTHLRYLGYNFNPVSFVYCHRRSGELDSILAEVNNTFAETENYWLTERQHRSTGKHKRYEFPKKLHVSPFMPMEQRYDWTFTPPGDRLVIESVSFEQDRLQFDSTLKLERRDWDRKELHRVIARFPMMTAKVMAGIYWQAIRLYGKGVPVVHHPGPGQFTPSETRHVGASWKVD
jgi:DUF1365 family protein